jgi:hypothetical protein
MSPNLVHYGVKGMHWGVRKNTPTHSSYTSGQQATDRQKHGQAGVKRINRRLNKGMTLEKARKRERSYKTKIRLALIGAGVAHDMAKVYGPVLVQTIAVRAETNRGRASAAETLGLPRTGTSGPTYSKANRKGAFKITNL